MKIPVVSPHLAPDCLETLSLKTFGKNITPRIEEHFSCLGCVCVNHGVCGGGVGTCFPKNVTHRIEEHFSCLGGVGPFSLKKLYLLKWAARGVAHTPFSPEGGWEHFSSSYSQDTVLKPILGVENPGCVSTSRALLF